MTCYNISQICCIRSQTQSDLLHQQSFLMSHAVTCTLTLVLPIKASTQMSHIAVCQSQLPLPQWEWCPTVGLTPCSCPWPSSPATLTGPSSCGRAVQWCLANPLYCQRSINPRSMIKNIINQHMKINVKCLYLFHSSSGEKG